MLFKEKTVLITGASSGIGKALAIELSKLNCRLVLTARRDNLIRDYKDELEVEDNNLLILKNDVSDKVSCAESYGKIVEEFGSVDVAILNAGMGRTMKVEEYNSRHAENIIGTNFMGIIYWVEQLVPDFIKRKTGIIAGVSSMADNRGYSGSGFYSASKAAATIYLEGLRIELYKHNVRVITIRPGFVKTPMTAKNNFEMPFLMSPEKSAKYIAKGIEKEKRVIQFPSAMVLITTLVGLIPGRIYELLASRVDKK